TRSVSRARRLGIVHAAVDFDDETIRRNVEVDHERIEHVLPPHAHAELLLTEMPPETAPPWALAGIFRGGLARKRQPGAVAKPFVRRSHIDLGIDRSRSRARARQRSRQSQASKERAPLPNPLNF